MPKKQRYISLEVDPYLPWNRGILRGFEAYALEQPDWHLLMHRLIPTGQFHILGGRERANGIIGEDFVQWAYDKGIPQVSIGAKELPAGVPRVISDFVKVGGLAASHLLGNGYTHLGCFTLLSDFPADRDRHHGYLKTAEKAGAGVFQLAIGRAELNHTIRIHLDKSAQLIRQFKAFPKPIGFFARNLSETYLAHFLIREAGLNIPNDIGLIVGGNDRDLLESLKPSITGISRNTYGMGYLAAKHLQRVFERKSVPMNTLVPPGGVIERGSTRLENIGDPAVQKARDLIRERISEPIQLGDISQEVGLSESSLRRRFRAVLRHSPIEEVQRVRLDRAKELLETSGYSISEVSQLCGFAEPAQLSRIIKEATGLTPTQFRSHALRQKGS